MQMTHASFFLVIRGNLYKKAEIGFNKMYDELNEKKLSLNITKLYLFLLPSQVYPL